MPRSTFLRGDAEVQVILNDRSCPLFSKIRGAPFRVECVPMNLHDPVGTRDGRGKIVPKKLSHFQRQVGRMCCEEDQLECGISSHAFSLMTIERAEVSEYFAFEAVKDAR